MATFALQFYFILVFLPPLVKPSVHQNKQFHDAVQKYHKKVNRAPNFESYDGFNFAKDENGKLRLEMRKQDREISKAAMKNRLFKIQAGEVIYGGMDLDKTRQKNKVNRMNNEMAFLLDFLDEDIGQKKYKTKFKIMNTFLEYRRKNRAKAKLKIVNYLKDCVWPKTTRFK